MKKYILPAFIFIFLIQNCFALEEKITFSYCAADCSKAVETLLKLEDAKKLLSQANSEGAIGIISQNRGHGEFNAYWDGVCRQIIINTSSPRTLGSKLRSILFEMHNALSAHRLKHLYQMARDGNIGKEDFVESVERMEHQNALHTQALLEKGYRMGLFPRDCLWNIPKSFQEHYMVQQCSGHSTWIANSYDNNYRKGWRTPYQGTIPELNKMSQEEKAQFMRFIAIKNDLESKDHKIVKNAQTALEKELASIKNQEKYNYCYGNKIRLLHKIFCGNAGFEKAYKKVSI